MTQILSTSDKFDAVVQGYQRDSKAVAASVSDHLKMPNSNTVKCCSAVETLATRYAAFAPRIDAGTTGTPRLRSTIPWPRPRHRRLHLFPILSRQRLRRAWVRHPVHPVVVVFFLFPSYHPTVASTIQTLLRTRGGRGRGVGITNTPPTYRPGVPGHRCCNWHALGSISNSSVPVAPAATHW